MEKFIEASSRTCMWFECVSKVKELKSNGIPQTECLNFSILDNFLKPWCCENASLRCFHSGTLLWSSQVSDHKWVVGRDTREERIITPNRNREILHTRTHDLYIFIADALLADLQSSVSSPPPGSLSRSSGYSSQLNGTSPLTKQSETFDYNVEKTVRTHSDATCACIVIILCYFWIIVVAILVLEIFIYAVPYSKTLNMKGSHCYTYAPKHIPPRMIHTAIIAEHTSPCE